MSGQQPEAPAVPDVTRWRMKTVEVEAIQWHVNGDHPADNCRMIKPGADSTTQFEPFLSEGEIVRYYRNPDDDGQRECGDCGRLMHDHGWIDQGINGRIVCPGDHVVSLPLSTRGLTAYFPVAADVFAATYEPAEPLWMAGDGDDAGRLLPTRDEGARERAETAEAKLAAIKAYCRDECEVVNKGVRLVAIVRASDILAIIGSEESARPRITVDLNVRVRKHETYSGFDDVTGADPAALHWGDRVLAVEVEGQICSDAIVAGVDLERRLVYLVPDWHAWRDDPAIIGSEEEGGAVHDRDFTGPVL